MAKSLDEIVKRVGPDINAKAQRRYRELRKEIKLAELRERMGKTQKETADKLGIKQPSLSRLEQRNDMQLSTLKRFIESLGATMDLVALLPDGSMLTIDVEPRAKRDRGRPTKKKTTATEK